MNNTKPWSILVDEKNLELVKGPGHYIEKLRKHLHSEITKKVKPELHSGKAFSKLKKIAKELPEDLVMFEVQAFKISQTYLLVSVNAITIFEIKK